jgi:hypothetical protein
MSSTSFILYAIIHEAYVKSDICLPSQAVKLILCAPTVPRGRQFRTAVQRRFLHGGRRGSPVGR